MPVHPLVDVARDVASVLAEEASTVDRDGVPASHIELLKSSGLLGAVGPLAYGGAGADTAVFYAVTELLAAADLSTWFVQAQHHMPLRVTAASALLGDAGRERLLRPLCDGTALAGIVFSQLRSYPRVQVAASPVAGGWQLTGTAPWFTGWGLSDTALFSGLTSDGEVVMGFARPVSSPTLSASDPLQLAALGGTATVRLTFSGLFVADEDVVLHQAYADWALADSRMVVNAQPAAFGLARSAISVLRASGDVQAGEVADALAVAVGDVRAAALGLITGSPPDEALAERLALRVRAAQLMVDAAHATVVVGGGRSLALDQRAQRLVREATFLQVQAQTADVRAAQLRAVRARVAER
jgi:alkylation response protein AidB-like acyl-CoA dehydrogenase